jgi:hypothetical protein
MRVLGVLVLLTLSAHAHAAETDSAVSRALALLAADAPAAPVVVVHTRAMLGNPQIATAFTDGRTVFVNGKSGPYKRAAKGDAVALAAAIAHEAYHVTHGPNTEPGAYAEQLRVLRALGAKARDIEPVERAARIVTKQ